MRRWAFFQWRDRQDSAKLFFGDETKSLNDQRLFSGDHKKSHIQLKRLRSPSFHMCFRSLLAFSERHPFQRFLIGLPNNAVSILGAASRVLSGKCGLNSKTSGRRNNLRTHKESVFQGHTKIALSSILRFCSPFRHLVVLFLLYHLITNERTFVLQVLIF